MAVDKDGMIQLGGEAGIHLFFAQDNRQRLRDRRNNIELGIV